MDSKKDLLLRSAARLYSIGVELDGAKERIRALVESGVGYDTPEMAAAVREYTELKSLWDDLEQEHLRLREEILEG